MITGYIFNFEGRGAYTPDGKVESILTQADIDSHNRKVADEEWQLMLNGGLGLLYHGKDSTIQDWPGFHKIPYQRVKTSFHNMAGKDGRTDYWFVLDGSVWHGVNIGDNDIVRVRRTSKRGTEI